MKFFTRNPDRIFGFPIGADGFVSRSARLRLFEPENPSLFVPRSFGIGWDLNTGAVAVKLGLIRPDDSLPDLEQHIPPRVAQLLSVAPLAGAGLVAVTAAAVSRGTASMPASWTMFFRPRNSKPVSSVVLSHAICGAGFTAWNLWQNSKEEGVDVVATALTLGVQTSSVFALLAGKLAAGKTTSRPGRPSPLAALASVAIPVVTTSIVVGTVRAALTNLERKLRNTAVSKTAGNR